MQLPLRATRAEINLDNLGHNVKAFRTLLGAGTSLMAVVKAGGYGHGATEIATFALRQGAERLGVALAEEGAALREQGIKAPILVMGPSWTEQLPLFFEYNLTPTVFTRKTAEYLAAEAVSRKTTIKVHVKIDTGMGRIGLFPHSEAVPFITGLQDLAGLEVEGVFTHFASADEKDKGFAREQLTRFVEVLNALRERKICPPLVHAANSAAAIEMPGARFNLARIGISLYGHYPSAEVDSSIIDLKPLLTLKSRVAHVKEVPAGTPISYGSTHVTKGQVGVATIPAGYGDGYNRLLSNRGRVLIGGKSRRIIGRVCMDQFMVDLGRAGDVRPGDEVVLIGDQGREKISVEEIAGILGTINYEVLCNVGKRVPRVYRSSSER